MNYKQANELLAQGAARLLQTAGDSQGERPRAIEVDGMVYLSDGGRYTVSEWEALPDYDVDSPGH